LLPNYKHVPIAYNGRANSVRCASFVQRPVDQLNPPGAAGPVFAPSERLDYEVELGAYIGTPSKTSSARMRELGLPAMQLSRSQVASLYGSFGQMVAHHTSNGTISGPTADALGCLLEITEGGRKTLDLPSDEERRFLQDDDEVVMRGFCERDGFARIGFGECRATIAPSHVV
jgi:2-keto-4-pentenoate hydratase/2-oxohepta-3-ene-1,7-dioic acid hydratase in catechol pathway